MVIFALLITIIYLQVNILPWSDPTQAARIILILLSFCSFSLPAEELDKINNPCSVETSAWMIMNIVLPKPANFYQLNFGYQIDDKNSIFLNAMTWKYWAPVAINMLDPKFEDPDEEYPGYVRSFGLCRVKRQHITVT